MQQRNLLLFFVLAALLSMTYYQIRIRNLPAADADPEVKKTEAKKRDKEKEFKAVQLPPLPPATPSDRLLTLGGGTDSDFNLEVSLDPLGGGVRAVTLPKFRAADGDGRPAGPGETLKLVPAEANEREPSNLLLHYDPKDADTYDARPFDTLGKRVWTVVEKDGRKVVIDEVEGRKRMQAAFRTEIAGVVITKTYTLLEGEYHVGLQVDLERAKDAGQEVVKFRYQMSGPKGLPIEGKWYTSTFRNALIALEDKDGYIYREFEDLRQIDLWGGGNPVMKDETKFLRYAGVAVQYFASVIVVDDQQQNQKFLRRATSSLETGVARGKVKPGTLDQADRVVLMSDDRKTSTTIYLPNDAELRARRSMLKEEQVVAVVYHTRSYDPKLEECPKVAVEINIGLEGQATHPLWEDDITVRVSTDPVSLKAGDKVSHRYLLYNGPVKPSLLRGLRNDKERAVAPEVIDRYVETLKLNTLTDYHSPGVMGKFFNSIFWTPLVIKCTNFMHWVLGFVRWLVPSYGLSIILLTVMVRGLMFPLSRKQAMMSIKMQLLQPEMKKIAERYKDDPQQKASEQMALFKKHGVNPVGSCWVVLLQMPIFMGLYFALQESIQFRLASFWPSWIVNLAAPDMLFGWGRGIWFLSRDADYGGMFYLGPYFNLLPLFAVGLMVVQQQMLMPPPADKEQEMQQKMMRVMMIVMGIFFYKIAAGLCIYIITSTLWGFAERKLLPKAKPIGIDTDLDKRVAAMTQPSAPTNGASSVVKPEGKKPGRNKRKGSERVKAKDEPQPKGMLQRFNDWWQDVLDQAKKK